MWFRVRVSHPPSHVTHWWCDHMICKKSFTSTLARIMATNFSKVWLKSSWPEPSSHGTHLSFDHVIFAKRCISSITMPMTIKLGMVRVKESQLLTEVTCRSSDHLLFEKRHVSTNARPQNSAGDIKYRKLTNQKLFLLLKRY